MLIVYYSPHPTHDIVSEVGYATHQREVILALQRAGHEVIPVIMGGTDTASLNPLTSVTYKQPLYKRVLKTIVPGFIWTTLNNHKLLLHDKKAAEKLEVSIINKRPDLIYERSEYLQDSGARIASKYGIRYFLEVNAPFVEEMNEFEGYSLYHKKAHQIEAYKLQKADKVFSVSSALSDFLIKRYRCDANKLILQPNCIDPGRFDTDEKALSEIKSAYGLNGKKVIGFVGSMFPYHGVDVLIKAFARLAKNHSDIRLLIVGDGVVMNDLKALAEQLKLNDTCIFTGKVKHQNVFDYIGVMDICIMARSNWYGSPVKLFEYGLMKKPMIVPDTAPVRDVVEHQKDGIIIKDNENELEAAMRLLIDDQELAEKLALNFHNKVMLHYTWDKAAQKIVDSCE